MKGPTKKQRSFGERADLIERWALSAGLIVVIGLLVECGPELAHSIIHRTRPPRDVVGNLVVTLGVAGEVILSWRALSAARKAELEAEERIATINLQAEQERLARVRLEQKFSARKISDESAQRLENLLSKYAGTRIDVYAFDSHLMEVQILADAFNAIFLSAGLSSVLWHVGAGLRMPGDDITVGIARNANPIEKRKVEQLAWDIGGPVLDSSMRFILADGGFSTTDPHIPNTMRGWTRDDTNDVAPIRLQIVQRVLVDSWSPDQEPLE